MDLIGTFMYVPWLVKFLGNFPRSEAVKKSRLQTMQVDHLVLKFLNIQFSRDAIERLQLNDNEREVQRTIIGKIMKTVDPETGQKFTNLDLLTSGRTFMYQLM